VAGPMTGSAKQSRTTGAPKGDEAIQERHAPGPLARNDAQAAISNSAHTGTWSDGFAHPRT
jgi:hypothetical protein